MHICRAKYVHLRIKMFGWLSINYLTFSRPLRFGSWIEIWWITSTTQMLEEKLCFDCFSGSLQKKTLEEWQGYTKKYNPHRAEFPKPLKFLFLWYQVVYHYWRLVFQYLIYWSCHKLIFLKLKQWPQSMSRRSQSNRQKKFPLDFHRLSAPKYLPFSDVIINAGLGTLP